MKTCTIESEGGFRAVILPEKGATVISLQRDGRAVKGPELKP